MRKGDTWGLRGEEGRLEKREAFGSISVSPCASKQQQQQQQECLSLFTVRKNVC